MSQNTGESRTIQSDEKLFDIVEYLRENDHSGVTEVAEGVSMAKSTAHGHLTALQRRGYVVKEDGRYRLGLEFLNHGKHVQMSYELYSMGEKKVTQLAQETGERAWCIVEENGLGYYLAGAEGEHPVHPPVRIGEGVHLHQISAGKVILSCMPRSRVEEIIERHGLPAKTPNTVTNREELFEDLKTIQKRGYAVNDAESLPGLYAIGAPIIDENDVIRGALSISGPANRFRTEEVRSELIDLLLGATNELEINLAYS